MSWKVYFGFVSILASVSTSRYNFTSNGCLKSETAFVCAYNKALLLLFSAASDVANFDGGSSLIYRLSARPTWTQMEVVSLKFKTLKNSGTLLHAVGQRDHSLALVLEKGRLLLYHQQGNIICILVTAHYSY